MTTFIFPDSDALAHDAAVRVTNAAQEAVQTHGRFTLALAGGKTPQALYRLLAQPPFVTKIDWMRTFIFMSDERCVPISDERSNFGMAQDALLSHVPIPEDNIFPCRTASGSPDEIAAQYAQTLAGFFGVSEQGSPPAFDLLLLGLGDDGHTASLFPHMPTLDEQSAWVVSSPPGVLPPPVERVTFTLPLINTARQVVLLVAGKNKAEAVRDILERHADLHERPAAGVQPKAGTVNWLLDMSAASLLRHP